MNNIKKLRNLKGITSKELSEKTGIPYDTLKNYEYNRREPSGKYLVALEKYFNKTGEYILGISNEEYQSSAHYDKETMDAVDESWIPLFSTITSSLKTNDPLTQKLFFNIMVELKAILTSSYMTNYQKSESISLLHDIVTGLLLSIDRAVVHVDDSPIDKDRIANYKQQRVKEYSQLLDTFFNNFNS